ncbi:ead/Ea22-like family protein [Citrobacter freundii]|uniref:ead/Ea22-like family protein n=1 Tax=Citrobacter freundii TaxID=546 RepID=UPI0015775173|nr:ead/Ea22-like family protein [Citrobacter freundii]EMB4340269.1 ead/Ea22-like family protein [Citrobacter freundii]MBJ9043160.1 ead/Ea22-like family protein [Citrobacter freundii]NTY74996.1 ead/Ea22-like family protein [Citrobacter freundii]NUA11443.1 ead/Ea22-like family protein [Citrobacter freundii]HAT7546456.1 ead/Ea22-like family protein [Citrobacter freundii]
MSNIDKQALRERYSLQPVPKCHICDAVMTIARASAGAVVYACSGCTYDDNGAHYAPGRSLGDEHYLVSRVTIFGSGDSDVLELLDELEAAGKRIAEQREYYEGVISDGSRRIAKLEARDETKFVKCWSCKHDIEVLEIVDCDGYCPRCASPIDLDDEPYAGIGVKGE